MSLSRNIFNREFQKNWPADRHRENLESQLFGRHLLNALVSLFVPDNICLSFAITSRNARVRTRVTSVNNKCTTYLFTHPSSVDSKRVNYMG